jgi:serine/threonine-protein kinase RsbW
MHNDQPIQEARLQVETDLNAVTEVVLPWFEEFTSPVLSQPFCSQCQLAFVEGFTNAVRHAHQGLPATTPIDLELKLFADSLDMRIWDHGQPFDFEAKLQEKLQELCGEEYDPLDQEGGRGLLFMHELTDELSYLRQPDERNCLLMRKFR